MCIHIQMISFYKHWFSVEKTLATRNNGVLWGRTGSSETWYGEFLHWIYFCLFFLKISLFLVVLGLRCCAWAFSSCGARASHCGGFSCCGAWALGFRGFNSWGMWAQPLWRMGLACSMPCGTFPEEGSNPCFLHQQVNLNYRTTRKAPLLYFLIVDS